MKKSGAFFSIQKSQIFPSTPNTYKKMSFGPLLTDIFLFLLLKGAKKRRLVRFWRIIFLSLLLKRTKKWGLVRFWRKFPYKFCLYP